ncbi:hypothetical protein BDV95DRAFT_260879 [Massariosphaeria phaeospora]|uniref:Uncharacterized protein n=1 Tax=Massariosphaeria phaeospora TaxID=100035 RepID=A0A7C8M246_9PLEO|nr:hypothetical protein BDV95DRAFT_260879 [Massariosphaeria phaeospora]
MLAIGICRQSTILNEYLELGFKDSCMYQSTGSLVLDPEPNDFHDTASFDRELAAYGEGTTIGCCVNMRHRAVFFTVNGKRVGEYNSRYLVSDPLTQLGEKLRQCNHSQRLHKTRPTYTRAVVSMYNVAHRYGVGGHSCTSKLWRRWFSAIHVRRVLR